MSRVRLGFLVALLVVPAAADGQSDRGWAVTVAPGLMMQPTAVAPICGRGGFGEPFVRMSGMVSGATRYGRLELSGGFAKRTDWGCIGGGRIDGVYHDDNPIGSHGSTQGHLDVGIARRVPFLGESTFGLGWVIGKGTPYALVRFGAEGSGAFRPFIDVEPHLYLTRWRDRVAGFTGGRVDQIISNRTYRKLEPGLAVRFGFQLGGG